MTNFFLVRLFFLLMARGDSIVVATVLISASYKAVKDIGLSGYSNHLHVELVCKNWSNVDLHHEEYGANSQFCGICSSRFWPIYKNHDCCSCWWERGFASF